MKPSACAPLLLSLLLACGGGGGGSSAGPSNSEPPAAAWARQAAQPLASVDPGTSDADLAAFGTLVGTARVVGLGESNHGTSEFQRMKHRLFRYLVEQKGFRAFGMEADMANCMAIDHYILTGEGDAATVVKGNGFWCWSTQEVLALVQWMRAYNLDPAHAEKLRFFGMDNQFGKAEMAKVEAYVSRVDPAATPGITALYDGFRPYANEWWTSYYGGRTTPSLYRATEAPFKTQVKADLAAAKQWLLDHAADCITATGEEDYAWALRLAEAVRQLEDDCGAPDTPDISNYSIRDKAMADNAGWFLQRMGPGGKVALWAHNGHLNRAPFLPSTAWKNTGMYLSDTFGADYFATGFLMGTGSVRAMVDASGGGYVLQSNALPTAAAGPAGSFELMLDRALPPIGLLSFHGLDSAQTGQAWWKQVHPIREFGLYYNPTLAPAATWLNPGNALGARFDALIYLRTTTATDVTNMTVPAPTLRGMDRMAQAAARF